MTKHSPLYKDATINDSILTEQCTHTQSQAPED